ncbi:MAG: HlyD family efflux transporter periplasmic adaptor subunit [Bacteroidota bacterium]
MDDLKDTSKEVKEVLGRTPNWAIRSGTTVIVVGFLLLFMLTAIIRYDDVVISDVTVTSLNPPIELVSRQNGELSQIFVGNGEFVSKGDILAELRNPAKYQDVLELKERLGNNPNYGEIPFDSLPHYFPNTLQIGDLQDEYVEFYQSLLNLILHDSLATNSKQIEIYTNQITENTRLLNQQYIKLNQFNQQLSLSRSQFERNQQLYDKGVISKSEFESKSQEYLEDQQQLQNLKSNISRTKISISDIENNLQRTTLNDLSDTGTVMEEFKQKEQNLNNAISDFEQNYLFISPIEGVVNMMDVWERFQSVEKEQVLFAVVPDDKKGVIGHLKMPVENSGKVKKDQRVIIKLSNYPFQQYGTLSGVVENISNVPNKKSNTYSVFIKIEQLQTSLGHDIPLDREMIGKGEIITEKLSLMQRMLYGLRKILDISS